MWLRVKLIPFERTFPVDTTLAVTLAAEAPGILAWAIRGCLDWQRDGLKEPGVVRAETEWYRKESDALAPFFDERCVLGESAKATAGDLYRAYRAWCDGRVADGDRLSQVKFGEKL
jgi:putative DNA primase/helicase